jgi:DNA polymerase I-like protein with 3'-5' exonuclease and polymerase domains
MLMVSGSKVCEDMQDAEEVLSRLNHSKTDTVVYDCETDGLDWRTNQICGHVFTFGPAPDDTYYVPVRHGENHEGNVHAYRKRLGHPFEMSVHKIASTRRDLHWVGHHFNFDLMMLHGHGVDIIGTMEDTEVDAALLDEFAASYSLENVCIRFGARPKKGDDLYRHLADKFGGEAKRTTQMGQFWKLPGTDPIGTDYACGDGVSTWAVHDKICEQITAEDLDYTRTLESGITRVIYRMKKRGIQVDEDKLGWIIEQTEKKLAIARQSLPDDFNVRSGPQMQKLMEKHGHTNWPRTPKGNPQFNEAFLKTTDIGRSVIVVRQWSNLLNSFAIPLRDRHVYKGRVHTTFHQMANDDYGTVTGRFSSSDPNLQQVPKRNKEIAMLLRQAFIPDDGMDWWDADLSQCEPRLLAHYSHSRVLLKGYLSVPHVDAHQAVANAAGIEREDGKRLNQTLITGGGKGKIITMLGARGADVYDAYFEAMPEVRELQKTSARVFERRGFVKSLLGRRARLISRDKAYTAMNRLLQVGNADIIKHAMVRIDEQLEADGDKTHLLNTVHDALSLQSPHTLMGSVKAREALKFMVDYGPARSVYLRVPMMIEYGIGRNWAEATFPKEKFEMGEMTDDDRAAMKAEIAA